MADNSNILRLGTRGSLLARTQSRMVADLLEQRHPGLRVELTIIQTSGDRITQTPLRDLGGKGLFVKELEQALLRQEVDFAVHSLKDVPVTMPLTEQDDLVLAAFPARADARDVLVRPGGGGLNGLPQGARVATGSLRRRAQLLHVRPDLRVVEIRGNIDTRLRKLRDGQCDAIVLAMAGLVRSGLFDAADAIPLPPEQLLPAPGQGALACQCRRTDQRTRGLLEVLQDPDTVQAVAAERELVRLLEGDCHSPIAAFAEVSAGQMRLRAAVGRRGGQPPLLHAQSTGPAADPAGLAAGVNRTLSGLGVRAHLHG